MIVVSFLELLKSFLVPLLFVAVVQYLSGEGGGFNPGYLLAPAGIITLSVIAAVFHWGFYRYDYLEDRLYIKKGVFFKQERTIERERIQTIHIEAGLIHRFFKLVKVSVETAGGLGESELEIKALERDKAYSLKETLENGHVSEKSEETSSDVSDEGYQVSFIRLLAAGLTSGSVFMIMGVVLAFALQFTFLIPDDVWSDIQALSAAIIGFLIAFYVLASWVVSVIRYAITYAFYTVNKHNEEISIKRGLIRQKHLSLKEHRIQSVSFIEGILRQPFRVGTIQVDVAGGSGYKEASKTVTHPLIRQEELKGYFDYAFTAHRYASDVHPLPKRALRRYVIRSALPFAVPMAILAFFTVHTLWLFIPMALSVLLGIQRHRDNGMRIDKRQLNLCIRWIARTTTLIRKNHIQSLTISRNILQRFRKLSTIHIRVLSSPSSVVYTLKDVDVDEAVALYEWLKQ